MFPFLRLNLVNNCKSMKKFKVIFIKRSGVVTNPPGPAQLCEQKYETTGNSALIVPPAGYVVLSITEFLPPVKQFNHLKDEKEN